MNPLVLVATLLAGTAGGAGLYSVVLRLRGRRRNHAGRCARCGGALYVGGAEPGPSVVDGLRHCARCTSALEARLERALRVGAILVAAGAMAGAAAVTMFGAGYWWLPAISLAQSALLFGGSAYVMRRRNQRALVRLAAQGELGTAGWRAVAQGERAQA